MLAVFLLRRDGSPAAVPSKRSGDPGPTAAPASAPAPAPLEAPGVDPKLFLSGELLIRVLDTGGNPIEGAWVKPNLATGAIDGEEGILPDDLMGGVGFTRPGGVVSTFYGKSVSGADGVILLRVNVPRQEKYLNTHLRIRVEAPGCVQRQDRGQLRLPKEGERKEITFRLQRGHVIRGRFLNLEGDDAEFLYIRLVPMDEEKAEKHSWIALPKLETGPSFEAGPAPPVPLVLTVEHRRDKYVDYRQVLHPPFSGVTEIVLQRDPKYRTEGGAVFRITNPPADGRLNHHIRIFSEERKEAVGALANTSDFKPAKELLRAGAYQAVLLSLDPKQPVWARASFSVVDGAMTEVPLTLEKSGSVLVRLREKSSGRAPGGEPLTFWSDVMIDDKPMDMVGRVMTPDYLPSDAPGEFRISTVPLGKVRIRVGSKFERRFKEFEQTVVMTSAQELTLDVLLEPRDKEDD